MKVLVFSFLLACASAQWLPYGAYGGYYGYPAYHGSRYQSQDVFGQASYGYSYPGQAASNFQDAAGNQIGSYAYMNPAGKEVRVSYVADALGFRVASNDLPVAVEDTPEVAAAKVELAKLQKAAPVASRTKRQAVTAWPIRQFVDDLHYRSVDLNKDGFPDVPVYPAYRYTLPYTMPYTMPFFAPAVAAGVPVSEKTSRKKRQILSVLSSKQFVDDLHYRSVDLNQDGQPDVPVYPTMPYTLPYTMPAVVPAAVPAVKYVAPAPWVAPAPLLAKTTLKTVTAEADLTAKTPADTNKFELKEKSIDVVTPLAYHAAPYHLW